MMIRARITPPLMAWLRSASDDGQPPLKVWRAGVRGYAHARRHDGSAVSPTEALELRALMAAHAAEPFRSAPGAK